MRGIAVRCTGLIITTGLLAQSADFTSVEYIYSITSISKSTQPDVHKNEIGLGIKASTLRDIPDYLTAGTLCVTGIVFIIILIMATLQCQVRMF